MEEHLGEMSAFLEKPDRFAQFMAGVYDFNTLNCQGASCAR